MNNKTFFKDAPKPNFESDQVKKNDIVSLGNLTHITTVQLVNL